MTALDESLRDRAAITGIGYAPFSRNSGRTVLSLAAEAATAAIADAGLKPSDIDGIIDYQQSDSPKADELAIAIGAPSDGWYTDLLGGGHLACVSIMEAVMAIHAQLATHVVCFRALNGRSGVRLGNFVRGRQTGAFQYLAPVGLEATPAVFAMLASRHMAEYGTTREQLGAVAIGQRDYALLNDRALMRTPLGLEEYLGSRPIAEPFHLLDCCQETDGACAVVLSSADVSKDMPQTPIYVRGAAYSGGPGGQGSFDRWGDFTETSSTYVGPELWSSAGCGPEDIDVAQLYDSFTWTVLAALEGFGFCAPGDAGPYVADVGIGLSSPLPVNTAGGLLSEGYVHGMNLITEAALQLRHQAGKRQVAGAELALVTATGGVPRGSALVLRRE